LQELKHVPNHIIFRENITFFYGEGLYTSSHLYPLFSMPYSCSGKNFGVFPLYSISMMLEFAKSEYPADIPFYAIPMAFACTLLQ